MSAWSGKPCPCGRNKSPRRAHLKFCDTCYRKNRKEASNAAHGTRILATYGITEEDYQELLEFQGGRCYICQWARGKTRRLCVDHDHSCQVGHPKELGCQECVRGLLCQFCNTVVGRARDAVEWFLRGVEYLRDPPYQRMRRGKPPLGP